MRTGLGLIVAALAAVFAGSGCCRLCHRWCDDRCPDRPRYDDCRRYPPPECYCYPPPRYYHPDCECGPAEGDRLPPPDRRYDTRSRYEDDRSLPTRRDARPEEPARRPTGAYGGTGN